MPILDDIKKIASAVSADFSAIRNNIGKASNDAGCTFEYQITSAGL